MARQTVLVLGGGVGGLVTANEPRRRLDPRDRVVVVERASHHLFQPSLVWLMVGRRRRDPATNASMPSATSPPSRWPTASFSREPACSPTVRVSPSPGKSLRRS
jgi:2-polyprenyl-6-methoxyphenol hydroxylase-like FAD-dependent oxidoreductase